jgi:hypothetical protein
MAALVGACKVGFSVSSLGGWARADKLLKTPLREFGISAEQ